MIWRCAKLIFLDIWRVQLCVCFWSLWFSKPTISSTVLSGHVLFHNYVHVLVCQSHAFGRCFLFSKFFSNNKRFLLHFILKNFDIILQELYFLNWYTFLTRALSSLLNGRLHYRCIATALKIIIYNNVVSFCLQTQEMYIKLSIFNIIIGKTFLKKIIVSHVLLWF